MTSRVVFWDTSAFLALLLVRDRWHKEALSVQRELVEARAYRLTTAAVLTEVANSLSAIQKRYLAQQLVESIEQSVLLGQTELIYIDRGLWRRGFELYRQRLDKSWGLTDCLSFIVMQERNIVDAFTADHHFTQAGFRCLIS